MSSAIDKLVKNNKKNEEKEKDGAKKNEEKDKKIDPEKVLEAKKKQPMMNNVMLLQKAFLGFNKAHLSNQLELEQKREQFEEQFAHEEMQNKDNLSRAILQNQQEKIQMAQTEADRDYEQRIAEYIQKMFSEEQELTQKTLENLKQLQEDRKKGLATYDLIFKLQQESRAATKKYNDFKENIKKTNEKIDKDYKDLKKSGQLDKLTDKKADKTMNIKGIADNANNQISPGQLKSFNNSKLQKEQPSLGIG
ncbi:MAG: hypothetical protein IJT14_02390 [Rickettsiales bacterium]|nr:hypothetical protein [Rickettsiales bacterium]